MHGIGGRDERGAPRFWIEVRDTDPGWEVIEMCLRYVPGPRVTLIVITTGRGGVLRLYRRGSRIHLHSGRLAAHVDSVEAAIRIARRWVHRSGPVVPPGRRMWAEDVGAAYGLRLVLGSAVGGSLARALLAEDELDWLAGAGHS